MRHSSVRRSTSPSSSYRQSGQVDSFFMQFLCMYINFICIGVVVAQAVEFLSVPVLAVYMLVSLQTLNPELFLMLHHW